MKKIDMSYICEELQLDEETIIRWIECRLVEPADSSTPYFDEEDLSRIRFIAEMQNLYSSNDESLEIILHLVDQIHHLTAEIKKIKE